MPEKRDYILFIDDIIEAITKIEKYSKDLNQQSFSENEMIIDAVTRNFEIIGEAANNIPRDIQEKYSYIEWKEITGFRNVLIHGYFGIDVDTIWETIKNNLPLLKEHILKFKNEYKV